MKLPLIYHLLWYFDQEICIEEIKHLNKSHEIMKDNSST